MVTRMGITARVVMEVVPQCHYQLEMVLVKRCQKMKLLIVKMEDREKRPK